MDVKTGFYHTIKSGFRMENNERQTDGRCRRRWGDGGGTEQRTNTECSAPARDSETA